MQRVPTHCDVQPCDATLPSGVQLTAALYRGGMPQPPGFDSSESVVFVYERMADHLEGRIRSGEFPPGSRLPGEVALRAEYVVSLSTVRSAMRLLRERGVVRTRAPLGTFVVSELPAPRE
jgi:GntR family transcriptional regulator